MTIEIVAKTTHPQGMLYRVRIEGHAMSILFLFHAIERMKKWGLSDQMVLETLL